MLSKVIYHQYFCNQNNNNETHQFAQLINEILIKVKTEVFDLCKSIFVPQTNFDVRWICHWRCWLILKMLMSLMFLSISFPFSRDLFPTLDNTVCMYVHISFSYLWLTVRQTSRRVKQRRVEEDVPPSNRNLQTARDSFATSGA